MKVVAIIQARMSSTRLPGKVLKSINGKSLLEYQIERVQRAQTIDQIIIATTLKDGDTPIVDLCKRLDIEYYRGSENDVLSRYYEAATNFDGDIIVRLTSDCPLIDPQVIDKVVNCYFMSQADYVSNTLKRTYPRGLDTEVFSYHALKKAHQQANLLRDREHVTAYFYSNPHLFTLQGVNNNINYGCYRWTVDTKEDFNLVQLIINNLYELDKPFYMIDVIDLLDKYPEWTNINAHIEQKKL